MTLPSPSVLLLPSLVGFAAAFTVGVAVGFTVVLRCLDYRFCAASPLALLLASPSVLLDYGAFTVGVAVGFTVGVAVGFTFCPECISMWAVLELGLTTTVPY